MSRRRTNGKGTPRANTGNKFGSDFKGFADVHLSSEALDQILERKSLGDFAAVDFLEEVTSEGYKFSLTRNEGVHSHIATLTGRDGTGENEGYALSGFGPTGLDAILALWGKHVVMCNWGAWVQEPGATDTQLPLWR